MTEKLFLNQYNKPILCKLCGGDMVFKGVGEYQCEKCHAVEYDDYGIVRNYIEEHKGATTAQISFATGVSQREINEMLREERFVVSNESRSFLNCEGCGVTIRTGRYCPTCRKLMEAATSKRKRDEEMALRKSILSGVSVEKNETASGERRFRRDNE